MFSINTNIASLEAQSYLAGTSQMQTQTIEQVTSGLRITSSGVDAAGLAIANGYRSDEAVLTQGIANANDGISQLQIIDGGMNNISQLLDRARTLATQSASGTFTGDRGTLNDEFQSVIQEIDRQAQAIGMNQGGQFAQALSVFVGGGKASPGGNQQSAIDNGTVNLDLSQATVDSKSLGLSGVEALGGTEGTTDIGTASATSVQNIVTNATNTATEATSGYTNFYVYGPGFSDTTGNDMVKVSVNLAGVTDTDSLVNAINSAITAAGTAGNQQATAFKNANITATINTDSTGKSQLAFSSSTSAFQIVGGDQVATALLGNFSSGSTGTSADPTVTAAANLSNAATGTNTATLRIVGAGLPAGSANDISITYAGGETQQNQVDAINAAIAANSSLAATGITASIVSNKLTFTGKAGETFEVQTAGDLTNNLGFGSYMADAGGSGNLDYTSIAGTGTTFASKTQDVQVSLGGGQTVDLGVVNGGASEVAAISALNTAFQGNAATRSAGMVATDDGSGHVQISAGVNFRLNLFGGTGDAFGFGASATGSADSVGSAQSTYGTKDQFNAGGENESVGSSNDDVFTFTGLRNLGDQQTVTVSAVDSNGNQHVRNITLDTSNAATLDQALSTINTALQSSNDATLQSLAAFKELNNAGTQEGIRLASGANSFTVSLGSTTNDVGLSDGGTQSSTLLLDSQVSAGGATVDITNESSANAAVTALANAVTALGNSQAAIGKGENLFTYAANLAQSQLTNETAAESQIRDANLAEESANLTKAQILMQAGVAALAQANAAPQQLLALLQGH